MVSTQTVVVGRGRVRITGSDHERSGGLSGKFELSVCELEALVVASREVHDLTDTERSQICCGTGRNRRTRVDSYRRSGRRDGSMIP